ncbi:DUF1566 domain-containing protein [Paenacidovorax monticola]|uniref:DUF1566 domain-containing protein n=1 Tax=Paenacidovorax monticola TaxID=1926868 RepID=A0A7H0HHJ1_9BURK|nr:DUF1566 domain-containing protein [Paenacidovorax monticola]QNP60007.1 DUF1566 domain-containing protein [Paenacidovorax monticola]
MPLPCRPTRRSWTALALLAAATTAAAQGPSPTQPHLVPSDDGAYVIDTLAKIAWPRCVEGMHWTGKTCTGTAQLFTHAQAQALATARWKAEGVAWRLPRVNELRRLVDKSTQPPALNPRLFPRAPAEWHWTATANVNTSTVNPYAYGNVARGGAGESRLSVQQGWAVDMGSGEARSDMGRGSPLPVRLVRPAP